MIEEQEEREESTVDEPPITPHTAIEETHDEEDETQPPRYEENLLEIPGVHKMMICQEAQKRLGCSVGEDVVDEKPWILINKALLLNEDDDEFLAIHDELTQLPDDNILVGYIPDGEQDQFFICTKHEGVEQVRNIFEQFVENHQAKLRNYTYRSVKRWQTLGSEIEIDESQSNNNRALIEVEIESKYPIFPHRIQLKARKVQDCRDGYMELLPGDEIPVNIVRRRIDNAAQITPNTCTNQAQTIFKYPTNISTQYEYEIDDKSELSLEHLKKLKVTLDDNIDKFNDFLQVNNSINLYTDDYKNLVKNRKYCEKLFKLNPEEYISFIAKHLSENKMVSCAAFHPMWTGIVALGYVNSAFTIYSKDKRDVDEVNRIIYDRNLVLLWCFTDDLKPKLILESQREVYSLSFCPWNPYLLIGGLDNGQIILWDITNKLERVDDKEILSIDQQRYRLVMNSLMKWMKNTVSVGVVRPTLISNLEYSHLECVHKIDWISPKYTIDRTGKIDDFSNGQSLQFITASEDGCLLIWDLLMKIKISSTESKTIKKTKRLKQRPTDLVAETSPFEYLHLNLRPIYKIKFTTPMTKITAMCTAFFQPIYRRKDEYYRIESISDRLYYEFEAIEDFPMKNELFVGSLLGDFIHAQWNGQEFDSGEVVNYEDSAWINYGKYHDGPIIRIDYSPIQDVTLVIGGRIISIWCSSIKNRPIIWRQSRSIYTDGSWLMADHSRIRLVRMDGHFETWLFYQRSRSPIYEILLSNGPIVLAESQERRHKNWVFGIAECRGPFRIYCAENVSETTVEHIQKNLKQYLERQITQKNNFNKWQAEFKEKFHDFIQTKIENQQITRNEVEEDERVIESKIVSKEDKAEKRERERIRKMILHRKQLDTEQLEKERQPLAKLEAENAILRKKQQAILKQSDRIFCQTIATLFPDVIKEKPIAPPDPYEHKSSLKELEDCYERFERVSIQARDFMKKNPFRYYFDWVKVMKNAKEMRKILENYYEHLHIERFNRIQEAAAEEAVEQVVAVASDEAIDFVGEDEDAMSRQDPVLEENLPQEVVIDE